MKKILFILGSMAICGFGGTLLVFGITNLIDPGNELNFQISYSLYFAEVLGGLVLASIPFIYFLKDTIAYSMHYEKAMKQLNRACFNPSFGAYLIAKERTEQIEKHKRTIQMDVEQNDSQELLWAAEALIKNDISKFSVYWDGDICAKMIKKSKMERLVIAGAFIAAEIDRLKEVEEQKHIK